jgi:hypothetical protein
MLVERHQPVAVDMIEAPDQGTVVVAAQIRLSHVLRFVTECHEHEPELRRHVLV